MPDLFLREEFQEAWKDKDPYQEIINIQGEVFR